MGKNFNNYITEIQFSLSPSIISFLSPLLYFFLEFWQYHCQNLLLSSFSQISLNSAHITNNFFFFWQYSTKRLVILAKNFFFLVIFFQKHFIIFCVTKNESQLKVFLFLLLFICLFYNVQWKTNQK